jgi:tetrahydromethanopterin S-methyltransferase subunit G
MSKSMKRHEIEELASEAAQRAVFHIQEEMGILYGDFAGVHFTDDRWKMLCSILEDYITEEISANVSFGETT